MRSRWLFFTALVLVSFALSVSAQQTPPKTADDFEKEHQGVFTPAPDKAAEASRLTAAFAGRSSATPQDVPIKNYIDEQVFGRMERDKIPHVRLLWAIHAEPREPFLVGLGVKPVRLLTGGRLRAM